WSWNPTRQSSWRISVKDKHYASMDELIAEIAGMSIEEIANEPWEGPHLISVDELRAAGALDVPASWRKSLGSDEGDLFSALLEGDHPGPSKRGRVEDDASDEEAADGNS